MIYYLMNCIDRSDVTPQVTEQNIKQSGVDRKDMKVIISDNGSKELGVRKWAQAYADIWIDNGENIGNAASFNNMLKLVTGRFIICAGNDIELKSNWLKASIDAYDYLRKGGFKIGLIGFKWRQEKTEIEKDIGKVNITECGNIFGTWVFHTSLFDKIGYFLELSKYGLWDSDYNYRARALGYFNFYLRNYPSIHLCNDCGMQTEYRLLKDKELQKASKKYALIKGNYKKGKYYLNSNQNLLQNGE